MKDVDLHIKALGVKGDGIANIDFGKVFVPFTVPGDVVRVSLEKSKDRVRRAKVLSILEAGTERIESACRHFTKCGGCSVQQLTNSSYQSWKQNIVYQALKRKNIDTSVLKNLIPGNPHTRRRIRVSARRLAKETVLGFRERGSRRVVALEECPVIINEILGILPQLREFISQTLKVGESAEIAITYTHTGLDITLFLPKEPSLANRERLALFAETHDVSRINWNSFPSKFEQAAEPIVTRRVVTMEFGGVAVKIPPNAFVQPTAQGEKIIREKITEVIGKAKRIVELFAGCGALALPLASRGHHVSAFDLAENHIAALSLAARSNGIGERVRVQTRNLHRRPLLGSEFDKVDAVILDPPRGGAAEQATHLAASEVPVIAYVSCDPQSFANDAEVLIAGGYNLINVMPFDQFLWSSHVELIGIFEKINA